METKKNKIITLAFTAGVFLIGCQMPKDEIGEEKASKKEIRAIDDNYALDIENFRKEADDKIEANERKMADFERKIAFENEKTRIEYDKKIVGLHHKNMDMRKKIDEYKINEGENWKVFKAGFINEMNEIEESLEKLMVKHGKK